MPSPTLSPPRGWGSAPLTPSAEAPRLSGARRPRRLRSTLKVWGRPLGPRRHSFNGHLAPGPSVAPASSVDGVAAGLAGEGSVCSSSQIARSLGWSRESTSIMSAAGGEIWPFPPFVSLGGETASQAGILGASSPAPPDPVGVTTSWAACCLERILRGATTRSPRVASALRKERESQQINHAHSKNETFKSQTTYHANTKRACFRTVIAAGTPWRFPSMFAAGRGSDVPAVHAASLEGAGRGDGCCVPATMRGALAPPL
jgi:hypothetical protein